MQRFCSLEILELLEKVEGGTWVWEVPTDTIYLSELSAELFGYDTKGVKMVCNIKRTGANARFS